MQYKKWGVLSLVILASFTWLNGDHISAIELLESRAQLAEMKAKQLTQSSQQASWETVLQTLLRQQPPTTRRPGGGRGELCAIAPSSSGQSVTVWNTRPLFVWQGDYNVIGVREKSANTDFWWGKAITRSLSVMRLSYSGTALAPGKTYEWSFFVDQNRLSPLGTVTFRVMDGKQRASIQKELQALEKQLKVQKATQEKIALQRTNYFLQKGLRADALQEIYSVKQPSVKLQQVMQDIEKKVCQSQE